MTTVAFTGRLAALDVAARARLLARSAPEADERVASSVRGILSQVRQRGDDALLALTREYDGVSPPSLEVPPSSIAAALERVEPAIRTALERAKHNLETVHAAFRPVASEVESEPGVVIGRRPDPLEAVGVYAPGGRAAYPSSVLMGVVPARVAGVGEVVVCSPPGPGGLPPDVVLAAAAIGGATRVFAVGGAQAIAALAYGTATIPKVDRIVGPGNTFVAEAKRQIAGFVGIDAPAGPSEILVIADEAGDPERVAREMLAQAEHDPEASTVALVVGDVLAAKVVAALEAQRSSTCERSEIVARSLRAAGAVLSIASLEEAWSFAEAYAAEHVLLDVFEPEAALRRVRHAGTVLLGDGASVAFGDYLTGANHVLPTARAARSFSGLSPLDFVRWTTYQRIDRAAASRLAEDTARLAAAEGLGAHAAAALAFREAGARALRPAPRSPSVETLLRPSYARMQLYSSNRAPAAIDLSDNTNLAGVPPAAERVAETIGSDAFARYPAHYASELKRALAARLSVGEDEIVTGCGSDDVLDSAIRAFGAPGDVITFPDPTFAMIPYFAHMNGLLPRPVPLLGTERGFDIDAEGLVAARAKITYICSPNNPTGTPASRDALERVLRSAPGIVLLDEAYVEYAGSSWVKRAKDEGRLLVVRTLSKAFGMAGLRVGYAVGAPALVAAVEKSRGPYKVSALAEKMAVAALNEDAAWVDGRVREVLDARGRFVARLWRLGLRPLPSEANFVLVPTDSAAAKAKALREQGVAVRPFERLTGIGDALRISVGPWSVVERALPALEEVLR